MAVACVAGGLIGCSFDLDEGDEAPGGARMVGAAGAPAGSSRTRWGSATLTGAWPQDSTLRRFSYRSSEEQTVSCEWDRSVTPGKLRFVVGDATVDAARVELTGIDAEVTGSTYLWADADDALVALFAFVGAEERVYEYMYAETSALSSRCHLEIQTFGAGRIAGHVACGDLIATPGSADYRGLEDPAKASVTLAFECPLTVVEPLGGGSSSGGGGGSCLGSATPCSLLSLGDCSLALGCFPDGECSGVSSGCYGRIGSYSCASQDGCYWSTSSETCSGVSRSCFGFTNSVSCGGQDGCYWVRTCEGLAWSCSALSSAVDCELQPGCYWSAL